MIFCDVDTKVEITHAYNDAKIQQRDDGIFQPLYSCPGYYNLDLYDNLRRHFIEYDMEQIFEYTNIFIMHSPDNIYSEIINEGMCCLFDNQYSLVRRKYFDLCLYDNWMRQPLLRGDKSAALLYCASVLRYVCHLFFLLAGKPYQMTLGCSCSWLDGMTWEAEETWHDRDNNPDSPEQRAVYIFTMINSITVCYLIFPTKYYEWLQGAECLSAMRNDPVFICLTERIKALIKKRPKQK